MNDMARARAKRLVDQAVADGRLVRIGGGGIIEADRLGARYPLAATVRVRSEVLPRMFRIGGWDALAEFITSPDFPAETESLTVGRTTS